MKSFYRSHWVEGPPSIEQREFGYSFTPFKKIETRHKSFSSEKELNDFLRKEAPFYISYSVGYFKFPRATPMENKVLLGSDLVFEFDVDEVGLKSEKDVWICDTCGASGYGWKERCPRCGSPTRIEIFPDAEREEKLKQMVQDLIEEFLIGDLGIAENEIFVNFSGNRGYHIHIRSPELRGITKEGRIEIAEYVTGQALNPAYFFSDAVPCGKDVPFLCVKGPKPTDRGWFGRIARYVLRALEDVSLLEGVLNEKQLSAISNNRFLYSSLIKRGLWPAPELLPLTTWIDIARSVAPLGGLVIDTSTTVDIHRLIRLPGTIHGTTGLVALPVKDLDTFDPYKDAVVLPSKKVSVRVKISPQFTLGRKTFGPFKDEEVRLPLYVAYFLIGRGVAEWSLTSRE